MLVSFPACNPSSSLRGAALFSTWHRQRVNAGVKRLFEADRAGLCEIEAESLLSITELFVLPDNLDSSSCF